MDKDYIWEQIVQFVYEERWDGEFTRDTDLAKDLKLTGDDAYEFICAFADRFNIDTVGFDFSRYFYPEGNRILSMILNAIANRNPPAKMRLTLGDLEIAVKNGRLV